MEVGCLCQDSLQELDPSMAALEVPLDMVDNNNLLMEDNNNQDMEVSLPLVDSSLGTVVNNLAMEVKEDMANLVSQTLAMALGL